MHRIINLLAALALTALPVSAQPRHQGASQAKDSVWHGQDYTFPGASPPSLGPAIVEPAPTPPTPPSENYSGEWVYEIIWGAGDLLPAGNGYPPIVRLITRKTCINGECSPTLGASLPDSCTIEHVFLGKSWLRSSCTRMVLPVPGYYPAWYP